MMIDRERTGEVFKLVALELDAARAKFSEFNSAHEGFAVILEEVDELKELVWRKPGNRTRKQLTDEAVQVAAMAIRFILDVADKEELNASG